MRSYDTWYIYMNVVRGRYCLTAATGEQCGRLATCGQMDTMPSVDPAGGLLFYTCYYPPEPGKDFNHPRGWVAAVDLRTFTHRWLNNGTGGIPAFNPYTPRYTFIIHNHSKQPSEIATS